MVGHLRSKVSQNISLLSGLLFLSFIVCSAPHLVHHTFDQSQATPCLAFSVAKGCHLKPTTAVSLTIKQITIEGVTSSLEVWIPHLTPSPFSKRAPPLA